jgi:hypothetical protein
MLSVVVVNTTQTRLHYLWYSESGRSLPVGYLSTEEAHVRISAVTTKCQEHTQLNVM